MGVTFTIITPCYNSASTIRQTMESVLNQTVQDYEYLIIDGGSTDGTVEILREYEKKFQGKMRFWSEKDSGIYDAMNKGIRKASGKIIGIINSDDWYEKEALENVLKEKKNQKKMGIYYGMMRFYENEKECMCALYRHEFLDKAMINHPTCFVDREVYEKFGNYDTEYQSAADYEFVLRCWKSNKVKFYPIYKIQTNFRLGGMSSSVKSLEETVRIKLKYNRITKRQYYLMKIGILGRKMIGII